MEVKERMITPKQNKNKTKLNKGKKLKMSTKGSEFPGSEGRKENHHESHSFHDKEKKKWQHSHQIIRKYASYCITNRPKT